MCSYLNQTTPFISPQCAAQSVGPANQLFVSLIQTLLAAQCSISPPSMWPLDYGPIAYKRRDPEEYDFIVIGAGSAGSVVAGRLSENPNWNVLLLEAGGDPPIESEIPAFSTLLYRTHYDWQFNAETPKACRAFVGGCFFQRGKMLGGSSAINAMNYVRGNRHDFDRWENEFGIRGWNYETALKYFKRSEGNQQPSFVQYENGRFHSANGPLKVDFYGKLSPFEELTMKAAAEKNFPIIEDINADNTTGYVKIQGTLFQGRRWSTAKAYLIPAINRPNLRVIKHAFVTKILINKKSEAYGVEFNYKGKKLKAFSRKEVILSAGSVMSPVILMNSGIGPRKQLKKLKIPVISDLPVGKNLIDHVCTYIWLKFNPTNTPLTAKLDSIYNFAIHKSEQGGFLSAFINTLNNSIYPDVQHIFVISAKNQGLIPNAFAYQEQFNNVLLKENENFDIATLIVILLKPKSRGFIRLNGTSPYNKPIIRPNFFNNQNDLDVMLRGVKQQLSLLETKAYRGNGGEFIWIPTEECDRFPFRSDDYLKCYIKYNSGSFYHPLGTSKMGSDSDATTVVDPFLKVKNVFGLRQIDAGVMPYTVSGNINAAVIMVAEHGAQIIKDDYE